MAKPLKRVGRPVRNTIPSVATRVKWIKNRLIAGGDSGGGGGEGDTAWFFTTTSTTSTAGDKHILSGATTVLTFPEAPTDGSTVECIRDDSVNVPEVARGGTDTIHGVIANMTLDTDQNRTIFVYDSTNTNWRVSNV